MKTTRDSTTVFTNNYLWIYGIFQQVNHFQTVSFFYHFEQKFNTTVMLKPRFEF